MSFITPAQKDVDEADHRMRGFDGDLSGARFRIRRLGFGENLGAAESGDDHCLHELPS
jgi:hypothetical protein